MRMRLQATDSQRRISAYFLYKTNPRSVAIANCATLGGVLRYPAPKLLFLLDLCGEWLRSFFFFYGNLCSNLKAFTQRNK
jgi:hypothetical protein